MHMEIRSAADFLVQLIRVQPSQDGLTVTDAQLERLKSAISDVLGLRYKEHWFPDRPSRGSGYRCIRINGKMDPVLIQAGFSVGLHTHYLRSLFPQELTMWIDPAEVSYRIGENGSICVLYEVPSGPSKPIDSALMPTGCKESLMLLDTHQVTPFEQRAAYVSS